MQGSARVIRCLQDQREELSYECRATLFDQEVRMAEDIDFKYPMKRACSAEIQKLCVGIPHGHARVIRCLQVGDLGLWQGTAWHLLAPLSVVVIRFLYSMGVLAPQYTKGNVSLEPQLDSRLVHAVQLLAAKLFGTPKAVGDILPMCAGLPGRQRDERGVQGGGAARHDPLQRRLQVRTVGCATAKPFARRSFISTSVVADGAMHVCCRLNYRLSRACQNDIEQLCSDECSPFLGQACGGRVLRCLTDKQDSIKSAECQNEVGSKCLSQPDCLASLACVVTVLCCLVLQHSSMAVELQGPELRKGASAWHMSITGSSKICRKHVIMPLPGAAGVLL